MMTDEQIIERCKAAGIKWIAPYDDEDDSGAFPGMFDMTGMAEMRALLSASALDRLTAEQEPDVIEHNGENIMQIWFECNRDPLTFYDRIAATPSAKQEPIAYVNGDDLDNMLDDRTATIQGKPDGWRKTPLFAAPQSVMSDKEPK